MFKTLLIENKFGRFLINLKFADFFGRLPLELRNKLKLTLQNICYNIATQKVNYYSQFLIRLPVKPKTAFGTKLTLREAVRPPFLFLKVQHAIQNRLKEKYKNIFKSHKHFAIRKFHPERSQEGELFITSFVTQFIVLLKTALFEPVP